MGKQDLFLCGGEIGESVVRLLGEYKGDCQRIFGDLRDGDRLLREDGDLPLAGDTDLS